MLRAAAMVCGLLGLWVITIPPGSSPQAWIAALCASATAVFVAARLGGVSSVFLRAPRALMLSAARAGAVAHGAWSILRAAISADVRMKPALVRVRSRANQALQRASFANTIGATPGMAVVEAEADGFLVHVIDEDAVDAVDLGRLEERVIGGGAA